MGWVGLGWGKKKVPRNSVFQKNLIDCPIPIEMKKEKKVPSQWNQPNIFQSGWKRFIGMGKKLKPKLNHISDR